MTSFADVVRPSQKSLAVTFDCLTVLAGSLFIALLAQIAFPLSFTPVPLTLQTLAILLIGSLLGSKKGALAVIAYIVEGCVGLPVFAKGGAGVATFMGPTGGYLVGFILCAFVVGYLLERGWKENYFFTLIAMVIGSTIILTMGMLWLSVFVGNKAFALGVYPFLIGDALKIIASAALIPSGWKLLNLFNIKSQEFSNL